MFKKKKNGEIFMIEQERERERKKVISKFCYFHSSPPHLFLYPDANACTVR